MKKFYWIILVAILILVFYSNISLLKYKKKFNEIQNQNFTYYQDNFNLVENFKVKLLSDNQKLSDSIVLVDPKSHDSIPISKVISNKTVLVFRYTELSCGLCVAEELENINKFSPQIGQDSIIMLVSYSNFRDLISFVRVNRPEYKMYQIAFGDIKMEIENQDVPYLFVTDSTLIVKDMFAPFEHYPDLSIFYYNAIIEKYFNHNTQ